MKLIRNLCLLTMFCGSTAFAAYPDRPIKLISGFAAGGSVDVAARHFATHLSAALGQPVVVDNRSGASGVIAAAATASAPADGYTLYFGVGNTFTVMPLINKDAGVESLAKLAPIGGVVDYTNVLLVNDTVPAKNIAELVAYAKKNPTKITYGSAGIGSSSHLSGEYLQRLSGAPLNHVPYRGAAPAMTDVLGGQISMFFDVTATAQNHVKAGRVKPLAVTSKKRNAMFPNVPTVAESGYPDYDVTSWFALFSPMGLPADVSSKLVQALKTVHAQAAFQKTMVESGYEMYAGDAAQVSQRIHKEHTVWTSVLKGAK